MINKWLVNPNRVYMDGIRIYNQVKRSDKYDVFLAKVTNPPKGSLQFNVLERELKNILRIKKQQGVPVIVNIPTKTDEKTAPVVRVVKINHANTNNDKKSKNERPLFFDSSRYDVNLLPDSLKLLYEENKKIIRESSAIRYRIDIFPKSKEFNAKRKELILKLDSLEVKRTKNFEQIDKWWNENKPSATNQKPETSNQQPANSSEEPYSVESAKAYIRRYHADKDKAVSVKERYDFLNSKGIKWSLKGKK